MKEIIFIKGEKIDLCIMDEELHLKNCIKWINDSEINRWLTAGIFPLNLSEEKKWFDNMGGQENVVLAITTKESKHIGQVGLHKINYIDRHAELGIIIGDKEEWGKGVGSEAEKLMIDFGFRNLGLNKIHARIFTDNIASQKAANKNGAIIEGSLKNHVYKNGKFNDILCVAFFKKLI